MRPGEMLSEMLLLVTQKFYGKYDKSDKPYVLHLLKVMHYVKSEDEEIQCIALGHDLLEDTNVTTGELIAMGFSERVVNGIWHLTKARDDDYDSYLNKVMSNRDAMRVKLADLRHNSDIRRLKGLTEKDFARMQKYHRMFLTLSAAYKE
ncbi:hypothetical protein [Cupriavidus sp. DL-D2]|uniref:hypothetical protein n=1 Tax=Cupriavidus sp. DL-D2 TaxID=3144974 RepID=UPI0032127EF4